MTGQANFLQSLGWAVLNSLWQLALLWVIYQVITGIGRNLRSAAKSFLASFLLISGFAWFLYTFFLSYTNPADPIILPSSFVNAEGDHQLNEWLESSLPVASVIYLTLLVLPILHFIRNYRYVQVVRKYGLSRMNVEWRLFVNKVAAQMNIRKNVMIWVSEFVSSPVTVGFLKPVILVPVAAINHLTTQQLEAVLLHELSHIKRFDYLVNLVINLIQAILYFNPFAKAFVKIVEREREKSCDEMVLQFQYDSHEYATALLTLEKVNHPDSYRDSKPLAVAASGKKNDLFHRIELILGVQKRSFISFNKLAGLVAGLLCVIALNAFLLFSKPGHAHRVVSVAGFMSPLAFTENPVPAVAATPEVTPAIVHHVKLDPVPAVPHQKNSLANYISTASDPALMNVSLEMVNSPELKQYQEEQVEKTMQASKKVLENMQWKAVEKNIADVFTQREKEVLKARYEKQVNRVDWSKWERQLKLAYDKVDWDRINAQLATAVNQVRLDSIQMVYDKAISKLNTVEKQLSVNDMNGIPDTDITLKEVAMKKAEVQKALNDLKRVRSKKIVHL